ncbi:MAG: hypothetical protein U1E91_02200 [Moraxella sp.]
MSFYKTRLPVFRPRSRARASILPPVCLQSGNSESRIFCRRRCHLPQSHRRALNLNDAIRTRLAPNMADMALANQSADLVMSSFALH